MGNINNAVRVCCVVLLCSCNNGSDPSSTTETSTFFLAMMYASDSYWDKNMDTTITAQNVELSAYGFSNPILSTLSIKLNSKSPDLLLSTDNHTDLISSTGSAGIFLNESFSGQKQLQFGTDKGNATASVEIPSPTVITSHNSYDTVSPNTSIVVTWNGNSDWYRFNAFNLSSSRDNIFDTAVVGNSFTIPVNKIASTFSTLYIYVQGINGPIPYSNSLGNISGEGNGFAFAANTSGPSTDHDITLYLRGRLNKGLAKETISSGQDPKSTLEFLKAHFCQF